MSSTNSSPTSGLPLTVKILIGALGTAVVFLFVMVLLLAATRGNAAPAEVVTGSPTPERLLETVEKYEEDLTDSARPHPPLHAVITVGEAIEAAPGRDRSTDTDPIAFELRRQLEAMLEESKARRRKPQ